MTSEHVVQQSPFCAPQNRTKIRFVTRRTNDNNREVFESNGKSQHIA